MVKEGGAVPLYTEKAPLDVHEMDVIREGLERELGGFYEECRVSVEQCPDLREWGLAFPGICGSERLVDVGGVPNLLDPTFHQLSFSLEDVCRSADLPVACVLGAAAGDAKFVGCNAELIPCEVVGGGDRTTRVAKLSADGKPIIEEYKHSRMGYLGNLYLSEGLRGEVLKVEVRHRTGDKGDFTAALRDSLAKAFPGEAIGLGGVFRLDAGSFKAHIMPDFKSTVMVDGPEVDEWLKFFEFGPRATFLSTLLSGDPSAGALNLRLSHTHFFNPETGEGGHYHNDVTPATAAYTGYFVPAKFVYRVENAFDRSRCSVPPPA